MKYIGLTFLICSLVVGLTFFLGWFYRKSTITRSNDFEDRKILNSNKSEKARKESEIKEKHAKIRDDYEAKYPGLKKVGYEE